MKQPTDALLTRVSLIQRVKGDRNDPAWSELLVYYTPFVNKVLGGMGLRGADLDDVRQLVLMRIWEGLEKYTRNEKQARFRSWLSTLIRNTAINWFKSNNRKRTDSIDASGIDIFALENPQVEEQIQTEWEHYIVSTAMERLRKVFSGKAFAVLALSMKGASAESIAKELDIAHTSVYVLKNRVKTRLTQEIQNLRFDLEGWHE